MDNTTYEFFIRRTWQCERFQKGADTDTWESLMTSKYEQENAVGEKNKAKATKTYNKEFSEVKNYVNNAYYQLLKRGQKSKLPLSVLQEIEQLKNNAEMANTPENLHEIMRGSFQIINDNKL